MARPLRIVIAGGGTAGWMAAATFARFLETGFDIDLIESDAIGTVGVGEATIPQIRLFNDALGLDEDAFLRATGGTFKLGIEFVDWHRKGSRYMHAFGDVGRDVGLLPFHQYWLRARALGLAGDLSAYSLNTQAALAERMQRGPARTAQVLPGMPYAYHFDAALYARHLRRYAETRGVNRIEGKITRVTRDGESGDVSGLVLEDGTTVSADLYIDCTGFRGLLIEEALETGYEDWTQWLPCDRAVAVPSARSAAFTPYTRSTAHAAGWQWRIPLQHRTGNGVVFSSAHMSEDEATATLLAGLDGEAMAEPRTITFRTGKRRRMWNRNVVALGLAAGFMEPLESTSIHLIQSAVSRLLTLLPGQTISEVDRAEFNRQSDFEWSRIRDFIILHYKATERDDTAFWRQCRDMAVPDTLAAKIALWQANGHIVREREELFAEVGWLQVLAGQGLVPRGHHPLADAISPSDLGEFMDMIDKLNAREVAQMPSHAAFVAQHCAAPAA
ncbi:tryptophan 7-halogenase [Sphingomonas ginsenosidivorax]|uniref:Tryptophan 7-halogenase n=1 Tax=Sphingomonas ginsenosidivorax TaxID=862135 RepID=A0A5C6UH29_9SPHN|nr:tryptophan halogenase family protein [Sphingomonas ginsenosidivorax]TXC71365.1 tryptophan 7-halogenase [Sphingomonas ginsenosidivorax]